MKTEITKTEYWQIIGSLTVAAQHNEALREIEKALINITGEESEFGHSSDAIYCDYTADELIKKLNIKIKHE